MIHSVTGVILAGGKSVRMGRDKARLPYQNRNLIDAPIETLSQIFDTVILSVRQADHLAEYNLKKVVDRHGDIGPMGGITSVLAAGYERIFCVACDMPFLNQPLIRHLCSFSDFDAVVPQWEGRAEMMHAIYGASLLPAFAESIARGEYKLIDAVRGAKVRFLPEEEVRLFDPHGETFRNVNRPEDYEKL
jgi:molybdenum cofactor guanylyltransferase